MEQSQVMRVSSRKGRRGLHEDKRSWEESHRLAPGGSGWEPRESEVQEWAGQDRARSKKVGKATWKRRRLGRKRRAQEV